MNARMPVLFAGHGSPMNAIEDNPWSRALVAAGRALPRSHAILCVSAHWLVEGVGLTGDERPRTIHDFGGFPDELFAVRYPAPGDRGLAARAAALLGADPASALRSDWGLDHGAWSVLLHLVPGADVPVVQLGIDVTLPPDEMIAAGEKLRPLRDEGVLILASGNVTHNLGHVASQRRSGRAETPDWATDVDTLARDAVLARDREALLGVWPDSDSGRMAHPTPEHWLPLLYAYGASTDDDTVAFPVEGFDLGSLSMRSIRFG